MPGILGPIYVHGCEPSQPLMGANVVVMVVPQPQLISACFRVGEAHDMEQLIVVRAMASLYDSVLPGRARLALAMNQAQFRCQDFKGRFPVRMSTKPHGELEGVVCPDEKKGGKKSNARFSTPATVEDLWSGWISEYLSRVRK